MAGVQGGDLVGFVQWLWISSSGILPEFSWVKRLDL